MCGSGQGLPRHASSALCGRNRAEQDRTLSASNSSIDAGVSSMPTHLQSADSTRILTVISHQYYPSLVALDRWGLVPLRGTGRRPDYRPVFLGWDARDWGRRSERADHLVARVRRMIARFRPALVVLGIPTHEGAFGRTVRARIMELLEALGIPRVVRRIESAWQILVGRGVRRAARDLADVLVDIAFGHLDASRAHDRHRRLRWYALALGLVELARRHPRQAAALVGRDVPGLARLIRRQELRLRPAV